MFFCTYMKQITLWPKSYLVNGLFNVDVFYIHLCVLCMILYKRSAESEFNKIFCFSYRRTELESDKPGACNL